MRILKDLLSTYDLILERWFHQIYVVRCNTNLLFQRLEQRGYNATKIQNNVEYEIFQMALDEARKAYEPTIVQEVKGETESQCLEGIQMVGKFLDEYQEP